VATIRALPDDTGHASPLHRSGTGCLTLGAGLTMVAATTAPRRSVAIWVDIVLVSAGVLLLALFAFVSNRAAHPIVEPRRRCLVHSDVCARDGPRGGAALYHR
jgi:hypothetical protein